MYIMTYIHSQKTNYYNITVTDFLQISILIYSIRLRTDCISVTLTLSEF